MSNTSYSFPVPIPPPAFFNFLFKRQVGNHPSRVFTYKGKPIRRANTKAFKNVCAELGIEDFRWHDLRHTWATWHVQRGTPLEALQELGDWSDYKITPILLTSIYNGM